jgi:hypothetical protein
MWELWIWKVVRFITWQNKKYSRFFLRVLKVFITLMQPQQSIIKYIIRRKVVHNSHLWDVVCLVNWKTNLRLVFPRFWSQFALTICWFMHFDFTLNFCLWICFSATLAFSPPFSLGSQGTHFKFLFYYKIDNQHEFLSNTIWQI